jgi:hypoxanthine-DNA glycosylase
MKIHSFPSISNPDAKVLLLGTMPGVKSLALQQYYGHPQNSFWKLLFTIFEEPFSTDYRVKQALLLKHGIALWDVLQACEREGSLDSAIMKEVPNNFEAFLKQHPNITRIFFNGQKAAAFFKKHVTLNDNYSYVTLPSTSPANAGKSFEQKLAEWQAIRIP